jgi:hypothetical protein
MVGSATRRDAEHSATEISPENNAIRRRHPRKGLQKRLFQADYGTRRREVNALKL